MSPYDQSLLGPRSTMATPLAMIGKTRPDKSRWCWSATAGCFPWLRKSKPNLTMPPPQEMIRLYSDQEQPRRELPMRMPQRPSRVVVHPVRPTIQRTDHLGHYPGGLADDYYLSIGPQPLPEAHPDQPRRGRQSYMLGDIPVSEEACRKLIERLGSSQSTPTRRQPGPGLGLCTNDGLVFVEFGETMDHHTARVLGRATEFPFPRANGQHVDAHNVLPNSLPPLEDDFLDDWAEKTTHDVTHVGHLMAPDIPPMPFSDAISEDLAEEAEEEDWVFMPMARPAIRRRAMSDCFSVGPEDDEDGSDNESDADAGSIMKITQIKRSESLSPSYDKVPPGVPPVLITRQELTADLYMGRPEGPGQLPVIVEATTCKSMTAELCWVSDDDDDEVTSDVDNDTTCVDDSETTFIEDEEIHYSDNDEAIYNGSEIDDWDPLVQGAIRAMYRRTRRNLAIQVPTAYTDSVYEASPESTMEPTHNASPDITGQDNQDYAENIYLDSIPMFEDPGWLDTRQEWTALLLAGEDQACLARFAHLWDDPNAEPIDQSLFADFDGDFTGGRNTVDAYYFV